MTDEAEEQPQEQAVSPQDVQDASPAQPKTMLAFGSQIVDAEGLALPERRFRDAWALSGGAVVLDQSKLAEIKEKLRKQIDADAEAHRLKYLTPGDGMQMVYREKFEQATAVHGMGETAANSLSEQDRELAYPTLSASIGIEGATLWDCAAVVLQRYTQFAQLSLVVERTRLSGKKSISDAQSIEAAQAAYDGITWTV